MAVSDEYVCNYRDGALTLIRGSLSLVVPLEQGNVSIGGLSATNTSKTSYKSRGRTVTVRQSEESEASISLDTLLNRLSSVTKETVLDFVRGTKKYAGGPWSTAVAGDAQLVDCRWDVNTPDGPEYVNVYAVGFSYDIAEGDPNTVKLSGTIYKPTLTEINGAT